MIPFTDELKRLQEKESEIVNLTEYKIVIPYSIDATTFYTFLKLLWFEKHDKYMAFPFPVVFCIDNNQFGLKPMKPWGIVGIHNIKDIRAGIGDTHYEY